MSDQVLCLAWNGADDNNAHITLRIVPMFDSDGNFPTSGVATKVQLDSANATRPVIMYNDAGKLQCSLAHWSGHYNGPTLATINGQSQVENFSWVTSVDDWDQLYTSVVRIAGVPFYSYTRPFYKKVFPSNGPPTNQRYIHPTTIACHATDFDTSGNWNWTSNGMVISDEGPSLIAINAVMIYNLCLKCPDDTTTARGTDTIFLYAQDPATVKTAIYQAASQTIKWTEYSIQFPDRKFVGQPQVVTYTPNSGPSQLHVFMRTDESDTTSPNGILYFWIPIRTDGTSYPQTRSDGQLDIQNAGMISTAQATRSTPAAVVWSEWLFLFQQSVDSHLFVWKKKLSDVNSSWQPGQLGSGGLIDFNYFNQYKGGLSACLMPKTFGLEH